MGTRLHVNVVPGVPISLDDPVVNPPSSFTTNSSTTSLPTVQPSSHTRPDSPLKSSTAPPSPNISSIPRKPPPADPTHGASDALPSAPVQAASESTNIDKPAVINQQQPTLIDHSMPSTHTRKRSLSTSASPGTRDNGFGGIFRSRRTSNHATTTSASSSSQPTPTSISGPSPLKPPTTKPPTSGLGRSASTGKGEKRGNILGRLVKRFSTSRKIGTPADPMGGKLYQSALRDSPIPEDVIAPAHDTPATMISAPSPPGDISRPSVSPNLQSLVQKEIETAQASDIRDDLPHHIPTPRVFSPLILHTTMPPGSPPPADSHRIGSLMIANPDVLPSRTPSPPKSNLPTSIPAPQPPAPSPPPDLPAVMSLGSISSPTPVRPLPTSILNAGAAEQLMERKELLDRRTSYERHSTVHTVSGREPPPFPVLSTVSVTAEPQERERAPDPKLEAEPTPRRSRDHRESRTSISSPREHGVTPSSRPPSSSVFPPSRLPQQRESVSILTVSPLVPNQSVSGGPGERALTSRRPDRSSPTKESSSGREDHHQTKRESKREPEPEGKRDADQSKMRDHGKSSKSGLDKGKDRDHTRDRERRHHKDREHRKHRDNEGEKDSEGIRKRRSKDRHRGDSPNKAARSSEDRERRRHGEVSSDSTPPLTIHLPAEKRSTEIFRGSPIFRQASPVAPADGSTPPPQGSRDSPSRRRQPSTETVRALGKEWEIVPDDSISQHRVSRSKERGRSADGAEAASAAAPSSSSSLTSGIVQKSRSIVRMRRSPSADSSLTSRSRRAPTPPPKGQSTKPPTSGSHPLSARRQSTTPPPRGKSPSPQPSRPVISGPSPIGVPRTRKDSATSTHLRSSSSRPQVITQSTKPSSSNEAARPELQETDSSSVPRSRHPKSVSTEDLHVTRRGVESTATAGEVRDADSRRKRGQSWSVAQAPGVLHYPRSQPYPHVPASHSDGPANNGTGHSTYRSDPDATGPRAGSSHTSISMQAPIGASSVGRNQLSSSPQQIPPSAVVSDFYGRAVQQLQPATQVHSPYSNPRPPSSGYDPHTGLSAPLYSAQSNTLPPGYPASSSLTNLSQSVPLSSSLNEGTTLVQFSSRAPYPIAAYGQQQSSTSWGLYTSHS